MNIYMIMFLFLILSLFLIDLISRIDTTRHTKRINELIYQVIESENYEIEKEELREKIINLCVQNNFSLRTLECLYENDKIVIIYSYKNVSRLSITKLEFDV